MSGGTVSNCLITANRKQGGSGSGGGAYAIGGLLVLCQIVDNSSTEDDAGGIYLGGATMRNCLIARNSAANFGGGVTLAGGLIESCTIVSNSAVGASGGGGGYRGGGTAGTVKNSIVYHNTAANNATNQNFYKTSDANVTYTCTTLPDVAGTGNITGDPLFEDLAGGDYSLQFSPVKSPCIDAGNPVADAWMLGATDLAGHDRILDGLLDMGAYETFIPPQGTVFQFR